MDKKRTPPKYPTHLHPINLESNPRQEEYNECVRERPKCSIFSTASFSTPRNPFQVRFIPHTDPTLDPTEGSVASQNIIHSPQQDLLSPTSPKSFSFSEPPSPNLSLSNSSESIYSVPPHPHPPISPPSAGSTPFSMYRHRKYVSKSATSLSRKYNFS